MRPFWMQCTFSGGRKSASSSVCGHSKGRVFRSQGHNGQSMLGGMPEVTQILNSIEKGDPCAAAELLPLVYDELRKLAAAGWPHESAGPDAPAPPHWSTRLTFDSSTSRRRTAGTAGGTSSPPPPRPCAASWWTGPGQGVRKAGRKTQETRHRRRRPRHHGHAGPGPRHRRSSRQAGRRRPTRGPAGRAPVLRRSVDRRLRGSNRHFDRNCLSLVGFCPGLASQRIVRVRLERKVEPHSFNFLVVPEKISGRIPH